MTNINEICSNFIGSNSENDTTMGSYKREYQYIEWLVNTELGEDFTDEQLDELFEKYCDGYKADEFKAEHPVVTMDTVKKPAGTVEYEDDTYILLADAEPGEYYKKDGEPLVCYTAPAVCVGDEINCMGACRRYTVVWEVDEDYDPEIGGDPCDWDEPYEVFEYSDYDTETGEF